MISPIHEDEPKPLLPTVNNIRTLMGQNSLTATKSHFCEMDYQSTTGISARTNRRMMKNTMTPAGLAGLVMTKVNTTLVIAYLTDTWLLCISQIFDHFIYYV